MCPASTERLAVDGGPKTHDAPWPDWPVWDETEERALLETLRSGRWWAPGGSQVRAFEEEFARFQHARHGHCVTSGTAALEAILRALGLGRGDEVIIPAYTFVATASSVLTVGATPVFADVEPGSLTLDAAAAQAAITPRTRALVAVHVAGRPADMDALGEVANRHGLALVEDAAQAHAAEWKGRKVGAIGMAGAFSFQASKNLTAGEGGIVLTDNEAIYEQVWSVVNTGRRRDGIAGHHLPGGNLRMTEWQGAVLRTQLARLPEQSGRRAANAAYLDKQLAAIPGVSPLAEDPRITLHGCHLYIFRMDPSAFGGHSREQFLAALAAEGIACGGGYRPLYREPVFADGGAKAVVCDCPACEKACVEAVWLQQNQLLGPRSDMDDIARAVGKIQRAWG